MEKNIDEIIIKLTLLFPITTLISGLPLMENINKVLFVVLAFFIILSLLYALSRVNYWCVIWILFINYSYAFWVTDNKLSQGVNNFIYFPFFILFYLYVLNKKLFILKCLYKNLKYISSILFIWSFLVLISLPLKSSYRKEWGGAIYFGSFAGSVFRLAPAALFIIAIVMFLYNCKKDKRLLTFTIIPLYCAYQGGSRTYFAVIILAFLLLLYQVFNKKLYFYLLTIPITFIGYFLIQYTGIGSKISATTYTSNSYLDYWGTLTNGRSIFWSTDIQSFVNSSIINKILGNGFTFVYGINNQNIWAHNDFINIVLNFGIIGLSLYIYLVIYFIKQMRNNWSKFESISFFLIWFINAMFNMVYTYTCATLSLPLFALSLYKTHENVLELEKSKISSYQIIESH